MANESDHTSESESAKRQPMVYLAPERPGWEWTLSLSWIAGGLALWVPFFFNWRMGPGNFAHNLTTGFGLAVAGGVITSIGVLLSRRITAGSLLAGRLCSKAMIAAIVVLTITACGWIPSYLGLIPGILLIIFGVIGPAVAFRSLTAKGRLLSVPEDAISRFFRSNRPWNICFWGFLLLLYTGRDAYLVLNDIEAGAAAKWSIFAARFGTHLMVVASLALAVRFVRAFLPRKAAWCADFVVSLTVGITLIDLLMIEMWQHPVIPFVNGLTNSGSFNLSQEVAASGLEIGVWVVPVALAGFALLCFGFYVLLGLLSRKVSFRPSAATLMITAMLGWGLAAGEQALSKIWKPTEVWQVEVATFPFQVGPLRPHEGFSSYTIEFTDPYGTIDTESLVTEMEVGDDQPLSRPDIYIFMVETFRKDAITHEIAPFLTKFAQTECQPFGETYAASNCTPLSWFGTLHSRIPVFWTEALREYEPENRPGSYPLRLLKAAGYRLEVRAISDLSYKEMSALQFGSNNHLADVYKDDFGRSEGWGPGNREVFLLEDLRKSVREQTQGGGTVQFVALDSPHYNYYWPNDFDPPNKDYVENPYFGATPTAEEIQLVVNRYHNSVAWVDHALSEFVEFLKQEGKYDESIIIITGDHGEEFREHGSWFHCSALVKQQVEVPIMIKWPASFGETPYREVVSHLDVMPTLFEGLGFPEKYRIPLTGRPLLSEEAKGAIVASGWAGRSGISMAFVKPGIKAAFTWHSPWQQRVPNDTHLKRFYTLWDEEVKVKPRMAHERLTEEFQPVISEYFLRFDKKP